MSEISMTKCGYCDKVFVPEAGLFCDDCTQSLKIDVIVEEIFRSISELDKCNFNKVTNQHRRILKGSSDKLEAILVVLERYPAKE